MLSILEQFVWISIELRVLQYVLRQPSSVVVVVPFNNKQTAILWDFTNSDHPLYRCCNISKKNLYFLYNFSMYFYYFLFNSQNCRRFSCQLYIYLKCSTSYVFHQYAMYIIINYYLPQCWMIESHSINDWKNPVIKHLEIFINKFM